jgi:hypothetical protein
VQNDLVEIVKTCEWQLRAANIATGGGLLLGVVVIWVVISWRQTPAHLAAAVGLTFGCLIASGFIGLGLTNLVVYAAVARFNYEFPPDSPRRPEALEMLAGLDSPYQAAQKIRTALGVTPGPAVSPEVAIQAALDQLAAPGPQAPAHPAGPADPAPLHLGPDASPPAPATAAGKGTPDVIPLEVQDRTGQALLQKLDSARIRFVPLELLEKPIDKEQS